ncbi:hypothetical protein Amsp01_091860 [Amycolatopsis sp. NBRC 101858]|uniref:hypothetical protein n=1 Tax=Amycolatopsis sp. NBRC 101858 TaxID=3032200 RepID=UPI00249FCA50|nr:hypothetical protein [Amycolatopsis sp. NBRC 101858]GLY43163.1 hypothetical protein Amsp01_091860 [Amycolatopsis sp. NBRC 101858]
MTSTAGAVKALEGMRLTEIRRIVNMVVVVFRPDDGVDHTIHAQCSFRAVHGDVILIGSRDMNWPKPGVDRAVAFEDFTTMYDVRSESLTSSFAEGDYRVTGTGIGPGGLLAVEAVHGSDSIRLEIMPDSSGPKVESWRLFAVGTADEHHVYPPAAGRD